MTPPNKTGQENICECGEPHISGMVIHTKDRCYLRPAPFQEKKCNCDAPLGMAHLSDCPAEASIVHPTPSQKKEKEIMPPTTNTDWRKELDTILNIEVSPMHDGNFRQRMAEFITSEKAISAQEERDRIVAEIKHMRLGKSFLDLSPHMFRLKIAAYITAITSRNQE